MKITLEKISRLTISDVPGLDPIRVMLEDIGPGQGRINIECYGQSWANYWGGMGKETIAEFVTTCDEHYIAGKLSNMPSDVFDPDHLKDKLKQEVFDERRKGWISKREARAKFDEIEGLDVPDTEEQLWSISGDLSKLIGDEWWYSLPKKPNPDYQYLTRIICAVKEALKTHTQGAAA